MPKLTPEQLVEQCEWRGISLYMEGDTLKWKSKSPEEVRKEPWFPSLLNVLRQHKSAIIQVLRTPAKSVTTLFPDLVEEAKKVDEELLAAFRARVTWGTYGLGKGEQPEISVKIDGAMGIGRTQIQALESLLEDPFLGQDIRDCAEVEIAELQKQT